MTIIFNICLEIILKNKFKIIIQLSDPSQHYVGGEMTVNDEFIDLQMGDAVAYWYGEPHEVKMLYSGGRYVVNLRLNIPD